MPACLGSNLSLVVSSRSLSLEGIKFSGSVILRSVMVVTCKHDVSVQAGPRTSIMIRGQMHICNAGCSWRYLPNSRSRTWRVCGSRHKMFNASGIAYRRNSASIPLPAFLLRLFRLSVREIDGNHGEPIVCSTRKMLEGRFLEATT